MTGSKWAKGRYGLLWLKSAIKTIKSDWAKMSQLGPESSWAWPILTRSQTGQRSQNGSEQYHRISVLITHEIARKGISKGTHSTVCLLDFGRVLFQ